MRAAPETTSCAGFGTTSLWADAHPASANANRILLIARTLFETRCVVRTSDCSPDSPVRASVCEPASNRPGSAAPRAQAPARDAKARPLLFKAIGGLHAIARARDLSCVLQR